MLRNILVLLVVLVSCVSSLRGRVDVVVVGAGAAGLSAALGALREGANVLIIEKNPDVFHGTSSRSGAQYWIPNNHLLTVPDPKVDAVKYMSRLSYPQYYNPNLPFNGLSELAYKKIEAYYDNGRDVLKYYFDNNFLKFVPSPDFVFGTLPDYWDGLPENKVTKGRCLMTARVDAPNQPAGGYPNGSTNMQTWLYNAVKSYGNRVEFRFNTQAIQLSINDPYRRVAGIIVSNIVTQDTYELKPKKGIVFASGGFARNSDYLKKFIGGPVFTVGCANPNAQGDFLKMSLEVGGIQVSNLHQAWNVEAYYEKFLYVTQNGLTDQQFAPGYWWVLLYQAYFLPGDAMFVVNAFGNRVYNEKSTYNERARTHYQFRSGPTPSYPNRFLVMIQDQQSFQKYGFRLTAAAGDINDPSNYDLIIGMNRTDLASQIRARLATLAPATGNFELESSFEANLDSTWNNYNNYAVQGFDPEFGRGQTPNELSWHITQCLYACLGDTACSAGCFAPGPRPNPTMRDFNAQGPYVAQILAAGFQDTKGGPTINEKGEVLDLDGSPVKGLFGAGNAVDGPTGEGYWGPGSTLGPALVYGHIAGRNAAQA